MSYNINDLFVARNSRSGYQIEQSLRFDGTSGKLTRTNPASSGITNAYKWSYSFWIKHSDVSSSATITEPLLSGGNTSGSGYTYCGWGYNSAGRFWMGNYTGADYRPDIRPTDRVWRDPSAWEHFMLVYDTSEGTNTDRIKIYSNGVRWDLSSVGSTISSTQLFYAVNYATKASNIGYDNIANSYFDGYMAEVHFVDGQALDQYSFGEFDDNGVWRPIEYTGTYGLNGHYLKFDPSATNGIGHDHSGNGNNFTPSGFDTTNTGAATYDVMSDTPTTNWCTLNPLKKGSGTTISDGNLTATVGVNANVRWNGTMAMAPGSGKYYAEMTVTQHNNYGSVGLSSIDDPATGELLRAYRGYGGTYNGTAYGSSYGTGDVIGIAYDAVNGALYFSKNGTWQNSGDPTSGSSATGAADSGLTGTYVLGGGIYGSTNGIYALNFGQRAFAYTPPTGYSGLNTANLPAPSIKDGSDYFQTVLYTGNGADRNIDVADNSGNNWQPDLVWIKQRSGSDTDHRLFDQVRGGGAVIRSNNNNAEQTAADDGIYFAYADGFNIDYGTNGANYNGSSQTYAAWCWDAGGSGSSNTDGTITSTVSANPTAGFSIVTYTGTGSNATVGHGLGVQPSFYVVKPRSYANNWPCWHKDLTSDGYYIHLNSSLKQDLATAVWNGTGPSGTVFNIGTNTNVNQQDATFVAYCFTEIEGFSKISSWSGNGSTDGPFVHCGFRPAFLLLKNYRGGSETDWIIQDSTRSTYNVIDDILRANTAQAEASGNINYYVDFLSNGFKIRTSSAAWNESISDYLFLAFAENPFGGSGVSPATAR